MITLVEGEQQPGNMGTHRQMATMQPTGRLVTVVSKSSDKVFDKALVSVDIALCVGCQWAVFKLINPEHSFQRSSFTKAVTFPYRTTAFTGKIMVSTFCDFSTILSLNTIFVAIWQDTSMDTKTLRNVKLL